MKRAEFEEKWSGYAALLAYGPGLEEAPLGETKVLWLWQFFRPFSRHARLRRGPGTGRRGPADGAAALHAA